MKYTLIFIAILITNTVISQNHLLGLQGGFNLTSVSFADFPGKVPRGGMVVGASYEFLTKKQFSLGVDILYAERGYKTGLPFMDEFGEVADKNFKTSFNYDYLSIPVKLGFKFGNNLYGFMNLGGVPSLMIDAKTIMPGFNGGENMEIDVKERVREIDLAAMIELGGGYKIKGAYWVFTSIAYQYSFTNVTDSNYFTADEMFHFGLTFSLGMKFTLNPTKKVVAE